MNTKSRIKIVSSVALVAAMALAPATALAGLNILLTNDDGYGSGGITAMQSALEAAGHTVFVSAPASEQSGKSGSATADFGAIIDFTEEVTGSEWSVDGTPADSVSAGLYGLTPGELPEGESIDLVISGVNDGENISRFSNISGTVGAAMFALRRGYSVIVSIRRVRARARRSGRSCRRSPPTRRLPQRTRLRSPLRSSMSWVRMEFPRASG
jgi:5'-nucleotidase